MMDITVKTLDGQNRQFSVPEETTVVQFKEKIANSIGIPADTQRLIFHGRVLNDDSTLREYDVHGKVIHVVQRAPPSSGSSSTSVTSGPAQHPHHHHHHHHSPNVQSFVVGSFTIPQDVLNSAQLPLDGGSLNVHINLGPVNVGPGGGVASSNNSTTPSTTTPPTNQNGRAEGGSQAREGASINANLNAQEAMLRIDQARRNLRLANQALTRLERNATRSAGQDVSMDADTSTTQTEPIQDTSSVATQNQTPASDSSRDGTNAGTETAEARSVTHTSPRELSSVLQEIEVSHHRLLPFITQLREIAQQDPELAPQDLGTHQQLVDYVSEAMHALSHCYHNISDINYDFASPRPRTLTAQRVPFYQSQPNIVINARNTNTNQQSTSASQTPPQSSSPTSTTSPPNASVLSETSTVTVPIPAVTSAPESRIPVPVGEMSAPGSGEEPYVFVEMGPDSVTVNSISTHVVIAEEAEDVDMEDGHQDAAPSTASVSNANSISATPAGGRSTSSSSHSAQQPLMNIQGMPSLPGLSGEMVNTIVQSVLQSHGLRQGQPIQVNVLPVQVPGSAVPVLGVTGTINISPQNLSLIPQNAFPNTTANSASNNPPAASVVSSDGATTTTPSLSATTVPTAAPSSTTFSHSGTPSMPSFLSQGAGPGGPSGVFARIPILRQRAPMFQQRGLLPMPIPIVQPTDIYLPCISRHFVTQGVRDMVDQAQRMQANPANMMAGMMSSLFGQPLHARSPAVSERQSQQPGGTPQRNAADNSHRAQTNTTATQQGSISANPFAALFSQLLGGAAPVTGGAGISGERPVLADDAFTRLFQGIGAQASQVAAGNPSTDTMASFLESLGQSHTVLPGEGFLTDAFLCVAQHLTFSHLFNIFLGQTDPLNTLHQPLQQFIRDRVLSGAENTEQNLRSATERIIDEIMPDIQAAMVGIEVKPDVDVEATLRGFLSHQMLTTFKLILSNSENDRTFGQNLFNRVQRWLGELVVLTPLCLMQGQAAFVLLLQNRLTSLSAGMNPLIRQWMSSTTVQHISSFQQQVHITAADVQHYLVSPINNQSSINEATAAIVACSPSQTAMCQREENPRELNSNRSTEATAAMVARSPTQTAMCQREERELNSNRSTETTAVCGQATPSTNSVRAPATLDLPRRGERESVRIRGRARSAETVSVNGDHSKASALSPRNTASPKSDSWQEVLPADWVPVIEEDIQRQKNQRPQPPFSDAYLQGMPPKRRRLMNIDQTGSLSNMADYLPRAVNQAAGVVGVEPISSTENLTSEAADAEELQGMLDAEMRRSLSDRLENDEDYSADRFPNAQEYFSSKPKPS